MSKSSICIKASKNQGQKIITLVSKLELIDKSLEIQRNEDSLCIPIARQLNDSELTTLQKQAP